MNAATADEGQGSCCSACHRQLRADARFCPGCGQATSSPDPSVTTAPGAADPLATTSVTNPAATPPGAADPQATRSMVAMPGGVMARDRGRSRPLGPGQAGDLRCPRCGTTNAAERMLCGACGLDLATGDPQLTIDPVPADPGSGSGAPVSDDGHAHTTPWWVAASAGIVVLIVIAAAIIGLGLGPFAPSADVPPAEFDAASYPGAPEPLVLTDIATLTFQPPMGSRTFTPEHLVDGDPTTAWHGDADALPPGTEEKIDLILERPAWVTAVVIENGDQRDAEAYASTSRVQRVLLVFDGDVRVPVTLLDQGLAPQIVELEEPLLSAAVRIEILETVPGLDLEEVALTRLELLGLPAQGADVALAEERAALVPAAGAITLPA